MAKYFGGALPFSELEQHGIRWKRHYYRIMERQQAEEEVRGEFLYPKGGKEPKPLPSPKIMRKLTEDRIKKWHEKQK